jgi:SecD/SecF fusion protein
VGEVRETLSPLGYGDSRIQRVTDPELGENIVQISGKIAPDRVDEVRRALDERFGVQQADFSNSSIGPTFGQEIARTAIIAIIASLILISIYIGLRFEAKFAVPVLIALAHDLLITAGVYALTDREVTTSTVAALLTILGYSLYDTIIVFDRIRENVPRMPRATFSQIVNRSMSEVIVRSLVTSLSTLLPITALMLFGGETLRDFGFALLIGVASGTYSSIFIATPVLTHWKEREHVWKRREKIVREDHGGIVPAYADTQLGDGELPTPKPSKPSKPSRPGRRKAAAATAVADEPVLATAEDEADVDVEPAAEPASATGASDGGNGSSEAAAARRAARERRAAARAARASATTAKPAGGARAAGAADAGAVAADGPADVDENGDGDGDGDGAPAAAPAGAAAGAAKGDKGEKPAAGNRRRKKHGRAR